MSLLYLTISISILINISIGYQPCGDISIFSFGNAINTDFLGQYTQTEQKTGKRYAFSIVSPSGKAYKLWWSKFRNRVSRWSISTTIGDDGGVIAYKDSHALHPSEIARQRQPWKVYDSNLNKWIVDKSLHVKCNDAISTFEWKQDCLVLGITNAKQYSKLDALDYMKVSGQELTAKYYSLSTGYSIQYDHNAWSIKNEDDGAIIASSNDKSNANPFPNAVSQWRYNDGTISKYLSVHCEVPETEYYYKILREKNNVCYADDAASCQNFKNAHFDTVVMKDNDKWSFGISSDLKYFSWNETETDIVHKIPSIGIGTAGMNNDRDVILWAVNKYGYELIDSASDHAPWYQNEKIIGRLLRDGILTRDQFMVTTKLYAKDQGMYGAVSGLDDSLSGLNVDYIDIYLIHHPHCDNDFCDGSWKTSWRIIEDYYYKNKIKYVGISNFDINQFHELLDWTRIPVSVIQNWFDPFHQNDKVLLRECKKLGIVFQAYSTLGTQWKYIGGGYRGNKDPIFTSKKLKEIANKYEGKSVAQIVLRWALQNEIAILPSSSKEHRIKENNDIFDFELIEDDMRAIDEIV